MVLAHLERYLYQWETGRLYLFTYANHVWNFLLVCMHNFLLKISFSKYDVRYYFLSLSVNFTDNQMSYVHFFFRACSEDSGVVGLRYGSENLSLGASFVPFPCMHLFIMHFIRIVIEYYVNQSICSL